MLSKAKVQYEIFYLNLTKGQWNWNGREAKALVQVSLVPAPYPIPHLINQSTIN